MAFRLKTEVEKRDPKKEKKSVAPPLVDGERKVRELIKIYGRPRIFSIMQEVLKLEAG